MPTPPSGSRAPTPAGHDAAPTVAAALRSAAEHGWVWLEKPSAPGRSRARDEYVAIGPGGVLVISSRPDPSCGPPARSTPPGFGGREWTEQDAACLSAATASVTALLPPAHRRCVQAVACVDAAPPPLPAPRGPRLVSTVGLLGLLLGDPAVHSGRLSPPQVALAHDILARELSVDALATQVTTQDLDDRGPERLRHPAWDGRAPRPVAGGGVARLGRPRSAEGAAVSGPASRLDPFGFTDGRPRTSPVRRSTVRRSTGRRRAERRHAARWTPRRVLRVVLAIVVISLLLVAAPALLQVGERVYHDVGGPVPVVTAPEGARVGSAAEGVPVPGRVR